jgi:ABC-type Mn2+/Zn2+ transport system permease subunit
MIDLTNPVLQRALAGAALVSLSSAPLGVFLVLRRMSLMGDVMAHAILPGVAAAFIMCGLSLSAMSIGGLIAGLSVALLAGFVTRVTALREDASLAAFYLIAGSGRCVIRRRQDIGRKCVASYVGGQCFDFGRIGINFPAFGGGIFRPRFSAFGRRQRWLGTCGLYRARRFEYG